MRPQQGADIVALVDIASATDVLFSPPWRALDGGAGSTAHAADSTTAWLDRYPGGWQLLLPNGGDACVEGGVEWGFHGEACVVPWTVDHHGAADVRLSTALHRAPLTVERHITVTGSVLAIDETVRNTSPEPVDVMWSHHPAFGGPFLEGGCEIVTDATRFVADDLTPGSALAAGSAHSWPIVHAADGRPLDLSVVPPPDERQAHFGYLHGFTDGFVALRNPRTGLAVGLRWPIDTFPAAWFWQEVHESAGYPWFRRAYVTAIEPATTTPGHGIAHARAAGGVPLRLGPAEARSVRIEAVVFHAGRPVRRIGPGGRVELEAEQEDTG